MLRHLSISNVWLLFLNNLSYSLKHSSSGLLLLVDNLQNQLSLDGGKILPFLSLQKRLSEVVFMVIWAFSEQNWICIISPRKKIMFLGTTLRMVIELFHLCRKTWGHRPEPNLRLPPFCRILRYRRLIMVPLIHWMAFETHTMKTPQDKILE
jgi:hypothetical protein